MKKEKAKKKQIKVAIFLRLMGLNATASGYDVLMNGSAITVIGECTGIFSIIVYTSCIFAYPAGLKEKAIGMILNFSSFLLLFIYSGYHLHRLISLRY